MHHIQSGGESTKRGRPVTILTNALSSLHALAGSYLTKLIITRALKFWLWDLSRAKYRV